MKNGIFILLLTVVAFGFCACGSLSNNTGEDYGDITAEPNGAILDQNDHPIGWGESNCFDCHNTENMHRSDRTGTGLNLQAIRDLTQTQGIACCATCHGNNGVN